VRVATSKEVSVSTLVRDVVSALRQRSAERRLAPNLELWDGHRESLGDPANVTLGLSGPEAALRLSRPVLGTLEYELGPHARLGRA
jgi:hypothetical protein